MERCQLLDSIFLIDMYSLAYWRVFADHPRIDALQICLDVPNLMKKVKTRIKIYSSRAFA